MIRFFHRSASLVGLCILALAIGCGDSSKKKVTCDGGPCGDAGRGDVRDAGRDLSGDTVVQPDVARLDLAKLDTNPQLPDTATDTIPTDTLTDTPPVTTPDAAGDTIPDTRTDTLLPDTATPDGRDTLPPQGDTLIPDGGIDTPIVTTDTAVDTAADAEIDAPVSDASPDVSDDVSDDATDADIDTL